MANPFGGSNETLTKNASHANQANLIYAFVPRSSSVVAEAINATTDTPTNVGSYDADGYLIGSSSVSVGTITRAVSGCNLNSALTLIVGFKRVTSGSSLNCIYGVYTGIVEQSIYAAANGQFAPTTNDDTGGQWYSYQTPANAFIGCATTSRPTAQRGRWRTNTASQTTGWAAGQAVTVGNYNYGASAMGTFRAQWNTDWGFQYAFIYADNGQGSNTGALSTADIDAIIADPGAVLTQGAAPASGVPKTNRFSLLGVG